MWMCYMRNTQKKSRYYIGRKASVAKFFLCVTRKYPEPGALIFGGSTRSGATVDTGFLGFVSGVRQNPAFGRRRVKRSLPAYSLLFALCVKLELLLLLHSITCYAT